VVVSGTPLLNKPVTATEAALTAPASYDYRYYWNTTESEYALTGRPGVTTIVPYTRTAESTYFNYEAIETITTGLTVTMRFRRSNTSWYAMGAEYTGKYEPNESKIGSNASVGDIERKWDYIFNNQTNKDYMLFFDTSATGGEYNILTQRNSVVVGWYYGVNERIGSPTLSKVVIPAFTSIRAYTQIASAQRYFEAWYLQDLGVSAAYNEGYDDGEVVGYEDGYNNSVSPLWDGVELTVGVILNFVLFIMTLSVFDISLLSIGVVLLSVLSLVWILKALRG